MKNANRFASASEEEAFRARASERAAGLPAKTVF